MPIDVTFLIAAYNAEDTIAGAIKSALAQQGVSVEVVVADDCSTDRTAGIVQDFPAGRVRHIRLEHNRGPGGARNAGLEAARGRWIAVLDADDTVYPDRLSRLLRRAEWTGSELVVDDLDVVEDATGASRPMFGAARLGALPEMTLAAYIGGNLLFEKKFSFGYLKPVIEREFLRRHALRYVENVRIGEDYLFMASALAAGARCAVEPHAGYAYHVRPGSISRVLDLKHVEAMLAADEEFLATRHLDAAAEKAQAARSRSLRKAAAYLAIVNHLKERAGLRAALTAARNPAAVGLLKMPISVRLHRLARPFTAPAN
jgi:succinoglycan biosynthesis protein ExoO